MAHLSNKDKPNGNWTDASLQAYLREHGGAPAPDDDFLKDAVAGLNHAGVDVQQLEQMSAALQQGLQQKLKSKRHSRLHKRDPRISIQLILTIIIILIIVVLVYGMILLIKK